jgi:hypothetical protein
MVGYDKDSFIFGRKRPTVPSVLTQSKCASLLFFEEDAQWHYQNSGSIISRPGKAAA